LIASGLNVPFKVHRDILVGGPMWRSMGFIETAG